MKLIVSASLIFKDNSVCRPKMENMNISTVIGIMYRFKDIYHKKHLLTLYNSLIVPHLDYCILTWDPKININGHEILLLEKKA